MQRTAMVFLTAALVAMVLVTRDARAGVVIVTESEAPDAGAKAAPPANAAKPAKSAQPGAATKYSGRLYIDGDRVRMQGTSAEGGEVREGAVLFQAKPEALLVLNAEQKSYFEMTRADAKRIGQTIDMARTQVQAQMEKMSPEQRAMFEEAMAGFGAGDIAKGGKPKAPPEPAKAVATGASDSISGYACRSFDIVRGAKKIAEACVASWADLGLAPADVEGLRKLAAFQQQMFAEVNLGGMDAAPGTEAFEVMDQIKGLPLRVRSLVGGKRPTVMRVVQVERKDIDPKLFQVPPGYTKRSTPMS